MQKLFFLLFFLGCAVLLTAQETAREAEIESFTELVNKDSLVAAGDDIATVINDWSDGVKTNRPQGIVGWLLALLALISSLFTAVRQHLPFLRSILARIPKGDTVVYIFAFAGGLAWSLFDLNTSGEEIYLKTVSVFGTAVLFYKIGLGKLFDRIFKQKENVPPAEGA